MTQHSPSGVADPALVAARSLQNHRWYSTWYGAFGLTNLVMIGLVKLFGPPLGWILPIALGLVALVPLLLWLRRHRTVVLEHRRTTAVFWVGLLVLWAVTCPLALSAPDRRWIFWVGGAAMAVLGLVVAGIIRRRARADLAPVSVGTALH